MLVSTRKAGCGNVAGRNRVFIRAKIVKNEMYFSLVQGYRDEAGRVLHRTIISLGRK